MGKKEERPPDYRSRGPQAGGCEPRKSDLLPCAAAPSPAGPSPPDHLAFLLFGSLNSLHFLPNHCAGGSLEASLRSWLVLLSLSLLYRGLFKRCGNARRQDRGDRKDEEKEVPPGDGMKNHTERLGEKGGSATSVLKGRLTESKKARKVYLRWNETEEEEEEDPA